MTDLLNFDVSHVDWTQVASHLRAAAQTVAAGTPSPLDDLAIAQLGDMLIELIVPKAQQRPEMFAAAPQAAVSPIIIMLLTPIIEAAFQKLLERWRNRAA